MSHGQSSSLSFLSLGLTELGGQVRNGRRTVVEDVEDEGVEDEDFEDEDVEDEDEEDEDVSVGDCCTGGHGGQNSEVDVLVEELGGAVHVHHE